MLSTNCRNIFLELVYCLYQNFIINIFIIFFIINFLFMNYLTCVLRTQVSIILNVSKTI